MNKKKVRKKLVKKLYKIKLSRIVYTEYTHTHTRSFANKCTQLRTRTKTPTS